MANSNGFVVATKKEGNYKSWVNIQIDGTDKPYSLNWQDVDLWKELPSPESILLLTNVNEYDQEIVDAKEREVCNLQDNDVFEVVDFHGQNMISTWWVVTEKVLDEERVVKARLVARGFEEDLDKYQTDSPTCSKHSLRFVMVSASMFNWILIAIDIASHLLFCKASP